MRGRPRKVAFQHTGPLAHNHPHHAEMLEFIGDPDDTLDLHGFTAAEATDAVTAFVQRSRKRKPGALVHVITGRGRGSPGKPVLKTRVRTLLRSGSLPVAAWTEDVDGGGYLLRLTR